MGGRFLCIKKAFIMKSAKQQNKEYSERLLKYLSALSEEERLGYDKFQVLSQSLQILDLNGEYWIPVVGWGELYSISNYSRIKREPTTVTTKTGRPMFCRGGIMKQNRCRGYLGVQFCMGHKKTKYRVHRLFGKHFISNPNILPFINHKNGIRHDNRPSNLEWSTQSDNLKHAYRVLGNKSSSPMLGRLGRLCPTSKSVLQYTIDGNTFIKKWGSLSDVMRYLGLKNTAALSRACKNGTKSHGFRWRFVEGVFVKFDFSYHGKRIPIIQYDKMGNKIADWTGAIEIKEVLGFGTSNISVCCSGRTKSAYGYRWKYA